MLFWTSWNESEIALTGTLEKSSSLRCRSGCCVFERTAMLNQLVTNRYLGKRRLHSFSGHLCKNSCRHLLIYRLFIFFDLISLASITGYLPEALHFCLYKMRPDHVSVILFLSYFISLLDQVFTSEVESNGSSFTWDTRGYVFYCPCMGRWAKYSVWT